MGKRWFVTSVWNAGLAQRHLDRQGFESFFPVMKEVEVRRGSRCERGTPLFPGYAFVFFDVERDAWWSVNGTVGIGKLLPYERPYPLPEGFVEDLKGMQDRGELNAVKAEETVYRFQPAEKALVLSGSFAYHTGEFVRYHKGSLVLLMTLFGRKFEKRFAPHEVAAVA